MKSKRAGVGPCLAVLLSLRAGALACGGVNQPGATRERTPSKAAGTAVADSSPEAPPLSAEVARGVEAVDANDLAGAKAHFQAALQANPADADASYNLGFLSEKAGDVAGAEAFYTSALRARPAFVVAQENLSALYDDAERWDEALAIAAPALAAHPRSGTLHLDAAIAYGGKKDDASAVREFEAAVAIAPRNPTFRLVYGHWLSTAGRAEASVSQLKAAVGLAGKNVGIVAAVAHELHVTRAFAECVAVSTQAIALKDAAELWTERAACKIGQGDDAGALSDLRTATGKDPSYAPAQYYLGNELAKAGQYAPAVGAYQAFLKLAPTGPMAKGALEKIKLAKQHLGH